MDEALEDQEYVIKNCSGTDELKALALGIRPRNSFPCDRRGRDPDLPGSPRILARNAPASILFGVDTIPVESQSVLTHAIVNLSLITGNIGRTSGGIYPLYQGRQYPRREGHRLHPGRLSPALVGSSNGRSGQHGTCRWE